MLVMLAIMMPMKLWAQKPYAVLTTDSTTILSQDSTGVTYGKTLTFYYDDQKTARGGMSVGPFTNETARGWSSYVQDITTVVFDDTFTNCTTLTWTAFWFYGCEKLTDISGIGNLKTDNVTNMSLMFYGCSGLTSLDVSNFNTSNVTIMQYIFGECSGLTSLDVSNFNTSNVTYLNGMFSGCSGLTSLDVSNFNTSNVTIMQYIFGECSGLTSLDVSNFKTDNVTDMSLMFYGCSGLTNLDVSNFNTANVTNMIGMFSGCSGLTNLDVSNFKTDNVTDMSSMFYGCSGLTNLDVSNFKTDNVTNMYGMFSDCSGLTNLDVSNFKTDNVTNMSWMFGNCSCLTSLDVSGFNTANVTDMGSMFFGCSGLTSLNVSHFDTSKVKNMGADGYNGGGMFSRCSSLTSLDLSSFNTANVTNMSEMFDGCSGLTTIYIGNGWSTEAVTNGGNMFTDCVNLVGGAGTAYDSNHIDYTYAHIDGGTSNPGYFTDIESVRRWDFTKWSSETIANLKADAAASKTTGWSDVEKKADAEAGAEPTEAAKDNCFWLDAETTEANGVAIAELEGLVFNKSYCSSRKLAIAVNYPSTSLGDYAGGAYLWLGDKGHDCFTIPNVKNGQTITIELESHKTSEGRGITLIAGSTELDSFTTMTKASYSWTIPEDCDVVVRNTNGCHIYTITVSGEGTPTDTLEIYAVETGSTITPNQPIMATQSVVVTPGNDVEWLTNMSMGSAWVNPLDFTSNIYYPGSTTTYTFEGSMRGTNNPKDGDLEDGVSTGSGYKPYLKNFPKSGGFLTFEVQQEGSLIIPIRVFAGKPLYVTDKTGTAKKDIQFKDASGQTLALQTNPLCAVSADEDVTGFVSFNVQPGEKYYVFSVGSKARFGGYVFSKQAIDIDPATMANVIDSLDALPTTLEPYAVLTTDTTSVLSSDSTGVTYGKTLTFYYDNQKEARNGMSVGPFHFGDYPAWHSSAGSITKAVFDASFASCTTLTSTAYWFYECKQLTSITGISNLNTDNVTDMASMFRGCSSLTTLDVSNFNTSNVTYLLGMFLGCSGLTNLDVTNFNTSNVTYLSSMFRGCSSLTTLDVTNFNTANVTNMNSMFYGCSGLTNLDVSNFNTANVTDMRYMFSGCSGLTTLDLSNFNTANVTDMWAMFSGCSGLTTLNLSNFNTANVTNMGYMFNGCSSLTTLDVSNFNTANVTDMQDMFNGCSSLTTLDVTNFNTANVTDMWSMFNSCSSLTTIYTGNEWSTAAVTSGEDMFYNCTKLIGGRGTTYDENHTDYTYAHIDGGTSNPGYFTDKNAPVIEATFDGRVLAVGGSTTMTDALEAVGGRDEVAKTITAIVWNSTVALTNSDLQGLDNPNLLIYVNERSQAPQNRNNVVVNGLAMNVVLSDTGSGNCDFYAPQTFTAEMITYSREFKQATQVGVCRGWETISLPFMVQTITHADNGVIAPFGVDTSNKHFWLRQLSTNGLVSATKIEANLPYLISMPNDEKNYAKEYILKGLVTFSAENAVVPKTEPTALALADSSVVMMPALQSVGKSSTVWALNVGQERTQYFEGSTFERDYREVRPFEAYTIHRSDTPAPRFLPINDLMNSATGIETISNVIMTHDNYYHIDGRKVDGKPTKKGLYITNGRKVVVK